MRIQPFSIGPYGTISSVVYENSRCVIIDAPFPSDSIIDFIRSNNLEPEAVYLTHAHYDHIFGLPEMLAEYPSLQIYLSSDDFIFTDDDYSYTMSLLKMADRYFLSEIAEKEIERMPKKFIAYEDTAGSFSVIAYEDTAGSFSVLRTPGHTPGSVSLYSEKEKILFSGDTLFRGSIGRTDLGGSDEDIISSLRLLSRLPEDTVVIPGHGTATTIGEEKRNNPFMRNLG